MAVYSQRNRTMTQNEHFHIHKLQSTCFEWNNWLAQRVSNFNATVNCEHIAKTTLKQNEAETILSYLYVYLMKKMANFLSIV